MSPGMSELSIFIFVCLISWDYVWDFIWTKESIALKQNKTKQKLRKSLNTNGWDVLQRPSRLRADESCCKNHNRVAVKVVRYKYHPGTELKFLMYIIPAPIRPGNACMRDIWYLSDGLPAVCWDLCVAPAFPHTNTAPSVPSIFPNKSSCSPLVVSLSFPWTASSWPLFMQQADARRQSPRASCERGLSSA